MERNEVSRQGLIQRGVNLNFSNIFRLPKPVTLLQVRIQGEFSYNSHCIGLASRNIVLQVVSVDPAEKKIRFVDFEV